MGGSLRGSGGCCSLGSVRVRGQITVLIQGGGRLVAAIVQGLTGLIAISSDASFPDRNLLVISFVGVIELKFGRVVGLLLGARKERCCASVRLPRAVIPANRTF